jgi:hypothetical protein
VRVEDGVEADPRGVVRPGELGRRGRFSGAEGAGVLGSGDAMGIWDWNDSEELTELESSAKFPSGKENSCPPSWGSSVSAN